VAKKRTGPRQQKPAPAGAANRLKRTRAQKPRLGLLKRFRSVISRLSSIGSRGARSSATITPSFTTSSLPFATSPVGLVPGPSEPPQAASAQPPQASKYSSERAGREQLDVLAKNRFGAAKRWTDPGLSGFRANGSVRDDVYNSNLMEKNGHADELTQLSDEELELAMKAFKKFDRDRDGKLLPDEMLAFWKHISFLTVKDHAGSARDVGEEESDVEAMQEFDDDAVFGSVEGDAEGGMNLTEFVSVLQRFAAAEQALVDAGDDDVDMEYRILLSQAAASLMICDAISALPKPALQKAVKLFEKADVKRRGSIRMPVAAARLGRDRSDVPATSDLDKNGVLDFNEFVKNVLPRIMPEGQLEGAVAGVDESSRWASPCCPAIARPTYGEAGRCLHSQHGQAVGPPAPHATLPPESKHDALAPCRWPVTNRWLSGEYASVRRNESDEAEDVCDDYEARALTDVAAAVSDGGALSHLSVDELKNAFHIFRKFDRDGDLAFNREELLAFWRHVTALTASDHIAADSGDSEIVGAGPDASILAHLDGEDCLSLTSFILMLEHFAAAEKALVQRLDMSRDEELEYRSKLVTCASSLCLFEAVSTSTQDAMERALTAFKVADETRCGTVRFEMASALFGVAVSNNNDADGNGVLDFNEFIRFVMPSVDEKMNTTQAQDNMSAARQARELRSNARRVQSEIRRGSVRDEANS
jgi:Ca2+-binding EF-hand superfamily protein